MPPCCSKNNLFSFFYSNLYGRCIRETVLDLDLLGAAEGESWVYKGATVLDDGSPGAHNRCLLQLSRGGADATVCREFNLASKSFVQVICYS